MAGFYEPLRMEIPLKQPPPPLEPEPQPETHVSVTASSVPSVPLTDQAEALVAAEPVDVSSSSPPSRIPNELMHKNKLQEYAQKSSLPLPVYHTHNEGVPHVPKFRSTVLVDGAYYTSENTFLHRKAAEQDAARLALESILKKVKDEGCPLIQEDTVFCKSILNEYAVKMKLEMPVYNTIHSGELLPTFVSSLVFDSVSYAGELGKNKKEAEQLAARAVILSIMGSSDSGTILSEIIKSKIKLYPASNKVRESQLPHNSIVPFGVNAGNIFETSFNKDKEVVNATSICNFSTSVTPEASSQVYHPPHHEFSLPKPEPSHEVINPPIVFVPSVLKQPLGVRSSIKRRNYKNKKKANKKGRTDAQRSVVMPVNQAPPCSVAQ